MLNQLNFRMIIDGAERNTEFVTKNLEIMMKEKKKNTSIHQVYPLSSCLSKSRKYNDMKSIGKKKKKKGRI